MFKLYIEINSDIEKVDQAIDLQDAFEKTFDCERDKLFLAIGDKKLVLPIVYTFSDLLSDFINIISDILNCEEGKGTYGFTQNDEFDADWILSWAKKDINVRISWLIINGKEDHSVTEIHLTKKKFLTTWKDLFLSLSKFINFQDINLEFNDENIAINRLLNTPDVSEW